MTMSQLIPWKKNGADTLAPMHVETRDPFLSLHREVNRLFDDLWRGFDVPAVRYAATGWPVIELEETDDDVLLRAELPGMEEKDVEIEFVNQEVVIRGERREERKGQGRRSSEMYYGSFERRVPLAVEIEPDKARAEFRHGVLTITLPKTPQARSKPVKIKVSQAA